MSHLISVEISNELAQRIVDDPHNVDWNDKEELIKAIEEALEVDDA